VRLLRARVTNYRSVRDTGWFDVETDKTILVGPNEAGKTAVFRALETLNAPPDTGKLDALRDFPRSQYHLIQRGELKAGQIEVAHGFFSVDDNLRSRLVAIDPAFAEVNEVSVGRNLDNSSWIGFPSVGAVRWKSIHSDVVGLRGHLEKQDPASPLLAKLDSIINELKPEQFLDESLGSALGAWLGEAEGQAATSQGKRIERLRASFERPARLKQARSAVREALPKFVYYSSYFAVRPRIHLSQLAERIRKSTVDPDYDFGNVCLLKLLGFEAADLAEQGTVPDVTEAMTPTETAVVQAKLDERHYRLNAAAVELNTIVRRVWGDESLTLRFHVDGDYLKVVVEDELGVEVELDQRSHGFVWLVSFYVIFRAEVMDKLANAILLLDEPGLSLHALKQQEFRKTVSRLAEDNQTLYTTHSPFMVGPEELDKVRVVEMRDREIGTKVHVGILADDPRSLFPLQEALGYNLAQSLFAQEKNLVCEGLTDLWFLEGASEALQAVGKTGLDAKIAVVPAGDAGKVVYYGTILQSQALKVAALLDSDQAGDQAATQDDFVRLLPNRRIHRTKDYYKGVVSKPETEDLLRDTLVAVAKSELGWDIAKVATAQPSRPIVDIFQAEVKAFSKYKLTKAFLHWLSSHSAADMTADEVDGWEALFEGVNKSLA
jgi:hypothetical protein